MVRKYGVDMVWKYEVILRKILKTQEWFEIELGKKGWCYYGFKVLGDTEEEIKNTTVIWNRIS